MRILEKLDMARLDTMCLNRIRVSRTHDVFAPASQTFLDDDRTNAITEPDISPESILERLLFVETR
ncbi:MAG: hypothetical protein AAF471_02025 [Myxococcota bacterium]